MEVTVLVQAVYKAFEILEKGKNSEKAREEARELLYTSAKFTSESKSLTEKRAARDLLLSARQPRLELRNSVLTFFILFAFWILLSGRFDTFHLTLGVICSVLRAYLTIFCFLTSGLATSGLGPEGSFRLAPGSWARFFRQTCMWPIWHYPQRCR